MLSVLLKPKDGFSFYFELTDGRCVSGGGLDEDGLLRSDVPDCYRDLMLRALVSKCMNDFVPEVRARGEWGCDLTRFGFEKRGDLFVSSWDKLKLPHDCAGK